MRYVDYFGTLGPSCCDRYTLKRLFDAGMTGVRLNLSHKSLAECQDWLDALEDATKDRIVKRKLLIDLQGPELRIGILKDALTLEEGAQVLLAEPFDDTGYETIPVPKQMISKIQRGDQMLLDDGKIQISAVQFLDRKNELVESDDCPAGGRILAAVVRGGVLTSRKSIALVGRDVKLPTLTAADIRNLGMAVQYNVTGVMLPFVRDRQDLVNLRNVLTEAGGTHIKIYAKIENETGIRQLETFIDACDEVVIARGDLGNAVGLCNIPKVQEQIAITCRQHRKKFMVVTQMLDSMQEHAMPTRAEVTDVYHAVKQGAASLMLTAETAIGKYPFEAMQTLVETAKTALE